MRYFPEVHGSPGSEKALIIGQDTVYVHKNVKQLEKTDDNGESYIEYVYEEYQYTFPEYIQIQLNEQANLQNELDNAQLALLELYENGEE